MEMGGAGGGGGRPKGRARGAGRKGKGKIKVKVAPPSLAEIIKKAEELVCTMEFDEARRYFEEALRRDAKNEKALLGYAEVLLELGEIDDAKRALLTAISLEPEKGGTKYLTLAQLLEGMEALRCYQKGISLLVTQRGVLFAEEGEGSEKVKKLNNQIATAFCAAAEIFLTDACFEENAESSCEGLLKEAIKYDPENPEALQTLASFRLSQSNPEAARESLTRSYDIWKQLDLTLQPSYEFRTNTAKLFLEIEDLAKAREILELLVAEDDSVAEVWFLLAFACRTTQPVAAREHLEHASDLLSEMLSMDGQDPGALNLKEQVDALNEELANAVPNGSGTNQDDGSASGANDEDEEETIPQTMETGYDV